MEMRSAQMTRRVFPKLTVATTNGSVTSKLSTTPVIASFTTRTSNRKASLHLLPVSALALAPLLILLGFRPGAAATEPSPWWLAQDKHFEVYSHVSWQSARNLLDRFERLRVFW